MLSHRRLFSHPKAIQDKAKAMVAAYADPSAPEKVGVFFAPFSHNYGYGLDRTAQVAQTLAMMKLTIPPLFPVAYDETLSKSWHDQHKRAAFEKLYLQRAVFGPVSQEMSLVITVNPPTNEDELIVLFVEHSMQDQMVLFGPGNKTHVFNWIFVLAIFFAIFGPSWNSVELMLWLFLVGIIISESFSAILPVMGSSIIMFMFIGANWFGSWGMKKWDWIQMILFALTNYMFLGPLIVDPPLPSKLFLIGKSTGHFYHYIGFFLGWLTRYFVT
jgi:hypothetical protein